MTIPYRGDCTCGAISVEITLPKPIDTCNGLLGAVCEIEGRLLGAVNVRTLERYTVVPPAQTVHLSELDADTKVQRWSDLWMPFQVNVLAA